MRFFTPELVMRMNSGDAVAMDAAVEDWDRNLQAYQHHLEQLVPELPESVSQVARLSLHDWRIISLNGDWSPPHALSTAGLPSFVETNQICRIDLEHKGQFVTLLYVLSSNPILRSATESWPFSKEQVQWLYDELDSVNDHHEHRILFSDGSTLLIPFLSAFVAKKTSGKDRPPASRLQTA